MKPVITTAITIITLILIGIVAINKQDQARNERFDTCFATYQSEGMPREMYNEFMKGCFEK